MELIESTLVGVGVHRVEVESAGNAYNVRVILSDGRVAKGTWIGKLFVLSVVEDVQVNPTHPEILRITNAAKEGGNFTRSPAKPACQVR